MSAVRRLAPTKLQNISFEEVPLIQIGNIVFALVGHHVASESQTSDAIDYVSRPNHFGIVFELSFFRRQSYAGVRNAFNFSNIGLNFTDAGSTSHTSYLVKIRLQEKLNTLYAT